MWRGANLVSLVVVAFAVWALLASPAQAPPVQQDRLTRKELKDYYERLNKEGWSDQQFRQALIVCKGSQPLLDIYIDLRSKKVPINYIARSFYTVKGAPEMAKEYWEYAVKWRFHVDEVDWVFRNFPPNRIVRWQYFEYRSGGLIDPSDKKAKRQKPYSRDECMTVFRLFRCDMGFIKRYFDQRKKGVMPSQALVPLYTELQQKIKKEREEARKKEEERLKLLAQKRKEHKEILGMSESKTTPEEEATAKKEKKDEYVVLSEEELGKLLQVMDKKESEKAAKESKKDDNEDEAEPTKEETDTEKEGEPEPEGDQQ